MVVFRTKTKANAKKLAKKLRKRGLIASFYKRHEGYGVSGTRK
jgi:hypothetical protein